MQTKTERKPKQQEKKKQQKPKGLAFPECGASSLEFSSGCVFCRWCGYSRCN